jgi:hypothetical protein
MQNLKRYEIFEQEIQLKTRLFNGSPRYPSVADYLGLITKNADSGTSSEVTAFLKRRPKSDQTPTNTTYLLKFIEEALTNIKVAQPDLFAKIGGDSVVQKIKDSTTIK